MLARQTRVLRGHARAIGAVATGASGHLAIGNAATVDAFAQGDQFLVFGKTGFWFFAVGPIGQVAHVIIRQGRSETLHHGVVALAGFELLQLFDKVFWVLASQFRVGSDGRVAVHAVASQAHRSVIRVGLGQIWFGGFGGFCLGGRLDRVGGKRRERAHGKNGGEQKVAKRLHRLDRVGWVGTK